MMELIRKAKWTYIAVSVLSILLGVVLILWPGISANTLCYLVGAVLVVFGVAKMIGYFSKDPYRLAFQFDYATGIFLLGTGLLLLIVPGAVVGSLSCLVGLMCLGDGAFKLQTAHDARLFGLETWGFVLAMAIVTCLCGVALMLHPFEGAEAMMVLLGTTLAVDGLQNFGVVACTVNTKHKLKEEQE